MLSQAKYEGFYFLKPGLKPPTFSRLAFSKNFWYVILEVKGVEYQTTGHSKFDNFELYRHHVVKYKKVLLKSFTHFGDDFFVFRLRSR